MRTATVQDLRTQSTSLLSRVKAGEEIVITQRGKAVARLIPEKAPLPGKVDWSTSPAVMRDRSKEPCLTAQESLDLIHDSSSLW